ncbi:MAG TPA: RHS repeat-associated core domain-containing protein [Candidatus Angelobacter sp.]|nr:RHS repeat-associated core domain-containing protein [Candidatus Angelobacter sp.]
MTPGIIGESDLAGNLKSECIFFGGERVARKGFPGNTFSYYFSDHLKTASVITVAAGNIKSESDYYPWGGELQIANGDSNHYKFTGKEQDAETGLDYFGARYYSNAVGRSLQLIRRFLVATKTHQIKLAP